MSLRYNKRHLMEMLGRDGLDRADQQAIRFALWVIADYQGVPVNPNGPEGSGVPFWRKVRYTDDGCTLYQCLNCKHSWESRTEPGWLNHHDRIEGPDPKGGGIKDSDGTVYHYALKDEPEYNIVWRYCPYCSVEWKGPIRCDHDNEYMRGDKRLVRDRATDDARPPAGFTANVDWWWVIQTRDTWPDRDGPEEWKDENRLNPARYPAVKAYAELKRRRERCLEEDAHSADLFGVKHEARLIKMSAAELKRKYPQNWCPLRELY